MTITPFEYRKDVYGGTEYMGKMFEKNILSLMPKLHDYQSFIIPGITATLESTIKSPKQVILWMHNTPQQFGEDKLTFLRNKKFIEKIKYIVVLSQKHKEYTLEALPLREDQVYVIENGFVPLSYTPEKFKDIKQITLIHTSTSDRGLDILLESMNFIKEDVRLEIYNDFYPDLFEEREYDSRIRFFGKTPKKTVMEAVERAHIHAYPSTYPETFCISQVEAMSAGLLCVTSDLGALPEISGGFGITYPFTLDRESHIMIFAQKLTEAIETIKSGNWDPNAQIDYVNKTYSWEAIREKWLAFHETL